MTLAVHALALAAALLPVPGTSDFNGDGLADVAQGGNPAGFTQQVKPPWSEYVVFGKGDGAFVDVRAPGARGAIVHGPYSNYGNAPSVGDVNGDGLADMFVYDRIVLGQRGSGDEAGTGFTIRGGERAIPDSVLGAGDVNGDGIGDLVAFDGQYNGGITPKHRTLYLVFGSRTVRDVNLDHLRTRGVRIRVPGQRAYSNSGYISLHGVGDVDGDGRDDLAATADWYPASSCGTALNGEPVCDGRTWIVYGRRSFPRRLEVTELGRRGMTIAAGRFVELRTGTAAGDVDGDGYDDVLVSVEERLRRFESVVVWGGPRAHTKQRRVGLGRRSALLGGEVAPIGDFDGDGRGDLLGYPDAHRFEPTPRRYRTFVIRGHRWHGRRRVDPRTDRDGFVLVKETEDPGVFAAGDMNGDGLADVAGRLEFAPGWPRTAPVIFGSHDHTRVRPSHLGSRGFLFGAP